MSLSLKELSIAGASIYICEGTNARVSKNRKFFAVEFTNRDPRVITLFLKFLGLVICAEEERIKAELFIYPDHSEDALIKFWSKTTNIPINRFNKTIFLKQKNIKFKPNPLGTLKIRYTHKEHFLKIQSIIDDVFGSKQTEPN